MPDLARDGDADGGSIPRRTGSAGMGFTINHGSPGVLMAIMIVFGVAVTVIAAYFLLSVVKGAHDDVVEDDEPEG